MMSPPRDSPVRETTTDQYKSALYSLTSDKAVQVVSMSIAGCLPMTIADVLHVKMLIDMMK